MPVRISIVSPLGRRVDLDRLEPALERTVLLDVLAVLGGRRCADAPRISPRDSAGLRMLAASSDPFGRARADQGVQLVDEHDDVRVLGELLFMIAFSRSSNWPRYFVPATMSEMSRARMRLSARKCGTSPQTIFWPSPSTMAVFPTPGSPMRTALFFVRRQSTCWTCLVDLWWRPTSGSSWFFIAASVRSRLNSDEERGLLDAGQRRLLVEQLDDVFSDGVEPHPLFHEDGAATDRSSRRMPSRRCSVPM